MSPDAATLRRRLRASARLRARWGRAAAAFPALVRAARAAGLPVAEIARLAGLGPSGRIYVHRLVRERRADDGP